MTNLEAQLFEATHLDLTRAALIASGVETEGELKGYLSQIDCLRGQIDIELSQEDGAGRAKAIFGWLWKSKPGRYKRQGNFRLTQVLEAQLSELTEAVGNCLGLTVLYNVLCHKFGIEVRAVYMDNAFNLGPHVFSILPCPRRSIDVENIFLYGFDYQGHLNNPGRWEWGDRELVADIYLSLGNDLFELGDLTGAIANYKKAIRLNSRYLKAYHNIGLALAKLGKAEEAEEYLVK